MILNETYIVCNSLLIPKIKQIEFFKLDLGQALSNSSNQFNPADIKIQKHFMYHSEIINLEGHIGTLSIYTNRLADLNTFKIYNNDNMLEYTMDEYLSIYDNINTALKLFFDKYNIKKDVSTKVEQIENKTEEYVKPAKKFTEMTEAERIAYARNLK